MWFEVPWSGSARMPNEMRRSWAQHACEKYTWKPFPKNSNFVFRCTKLRLPKMRVAPLWPVPLAVTFSVNPQFLTVLTPQPVTMYPHHHASNLTVSLHPHTLFALGACLLGSFRPFSSLCPLRPISTPPPSECMTRISSVKPLLGPTACRKYRCTWTGSLQALWSKQCLRKSLTQKVINSLAEAAFWPHSPFVFHPTCPASPLTDSSRWDQLCLSSLLSAWNFLLFPLPATCPLIPLR